MKKLVAFLIFVIIILCVVIVCFATGVFQPKQTEEETWTSAAETLLTTDRSGQKTIYDGKEWSDLFPPYDPDEDDEIINYMESIHSVEYGTAGSSLKHLGANVDFILLSERYAQGDISAKTKDYLDRMNALQLDFFSCQLNAAYNGAIDLVNNYDEQYLGNIYDPESNAEIFDLVRNCPIAQLDNYMEYMTSLLDSYGVQNEWKKLDDEYFYNY